MISTLSVDMTEEQQVAIEVQVSAHQEENN